MFQYGLQGDLVEDMIKDGGRTGLFKGGDPLTGHITNL
jgi:hypothetical protein